jgi:hypothetical protein
MFERAQPREQAEEPARATAAVPPTAPARPRWWAHGAVGARPAAVPGDAGLSRALASVARERKLLRSKLSDELVKAKADGWSKAQVFAALRKHGGAPADADAKTAIADLFKDGTDERWMAEKLLALGPEPLWPGKDLDDRAAHAPGPEAGIEAKLPYPPEAGTKTPKPVRAFYFPGVTTRRALIVGGIHGNEPQGARVVEGLRKELEAMAATGKKPHFTVILVPVLFERTHDAKLEKEGDRNVGGVEPNRTYPRPGEDYKDVRARAKAGKPELMMTDPDAPGGMRVAKDPESTTVMLPETRALVALVERYQPERIASCHAHKIDPAGLGQPGDDPGVFVDPRVAKPGKTNAAEVAEDDALATAMLEEGWLKMPKGLHGTRNEPYLGNIGGTKPFAKPRVRYKASHPEGHSLGDWAPAPTATREGITTVTVEVPRYKDDVSAADKLAVEEAHRQVLLEIFLGDPAQVAAAQKTREVMREIAAKIQKEIQEKMREAAGWFGLGDGDKAKKGQKATPK